jgi:alpha-ketoglutarate-dependent taurine dioxygenase
MKTRALKNYDSSVGLEIYDIDLNSNEEIEALGRVVAQQNIVFIDQQIEPKRLHEIMISWGNYSKSIVHEYLHQQKLKGRHWREVTANLGYTTKHVDKNISDAVTLVTYKYDKDGKPGGLFTEGELNWHQDQGSIDDSPRVIGLMSVSDSANSQTKFLCTHDAYASMSSSLQSEIKELYVKHRWITGNVAPGLNDRQQRVVKYNLCALDGTETRLYAESVTGLPGIKFPSYSFDGFVGMSESDSQKLYNELKKIVFKDKWVYTQDWQDGQIVFMDQEITAHCRPTNVTHGSLRTMVRTITYWDKLFPHAQPHDLIRYCGKMLTRDEIISIIDQARLQEFVEEEVQ